MQETLETHVQFLGPEGPLEAWQPTPVISAWRIPWTEEPGGLQSLGRKESDVTGVTEHTALLLGFQVIELDVE